MLIYNICEFARKLIARLPSGFSYRIGSTVGDLVYSLWPRGRRNMNKSVASILNLDSDNVIVRQTARQGMRNFGRYIVDMIRYTYPKKEFFEKNFTIEGKENLDEALNNGKGVVLVSFHLGNLDLGIRWLSSLGYKVNAIVNNLMIGEFDEFLQRPRAKSGVKLISAKNASHRILNVLRDNEILAMMIDSPRCIKGVKVKLGSMWVMLPAGAATLSLRTGAKLIPCGLVRTSDSTFKGIIGKPIEYTPVGKFAEDTHALTQRTAEAMENITRRFIDQWYIFHPLFRDEIQ